MIYVYIAIGVMGLYLIHKGILAWTIKRSRDWAEQKDKDRDYWVYKWREIQSKSKRRGF